MADSEKKKTNIKNIMASDNYALSKALKVAGFSSTTNTSSEEWVNIIEVFRRVKGDWVHTLIDDDVRIRIQFFAVYVILGLVSLGMTILNAFTAWALLGYATFAFFILMAINCALCMFTKTAEKIGRILFAVEIIALFSFFAIVGNPEGFSILWSLMLPTCGMLLFRAKYGAIVSLGQLVMLIILFWTEAGRSILMYDYTTSFLQRFPLLYLACFFIGFFFEFIRYNTHEELIKTREQFEYLYKHDALTGLYNRYGLNAEIAKATETGKNQGRAFAIADLDHFKRTNDKYGHLMGDVVLKTAAGIIRSVVGGDGYVCRWGGEEFSIVFFDETKAEDICWKINKACASHEYVSDGMHFINTISIGLVLSNGTVLPSNSKVITQADENLYTSKTTGRDRVTTTVFVDGGNPSPEQNVEKVG